MNQPPSSSSGSSNKKHADFDRLSDRQNGGKGLSARLNWLRAGVLGANDGIVSTAGVVIGVAGATELDGLVTLEDFAQQVGYVLPEGPYDTVAGFVMSELGRLAVSGDVILLSPATASFDLYKGMAFRGQDFKNIVGGLA